MTAADGARPKAVIVEDDPVIASSLEHDLEALGYVVCGTASTPTDAMELLHRYEPDVVTLDVDLGGSAEGIAVATVLRTTAPWPIVFVTGTASERHDQLIGFEASAVVAKPFTRQDLQRGIDTALRRAAGG